MRDARVGLLLLAVGVGTALIKRSKPLARYVGDQLIRTGEYLRAGTSDAASAAQPDVANPSSSSSEVPRPNTAGGYEQELQERKAAENAGAGDGAVPEAINPSPQKKRKSTPPGQPQNPKRTKNSRAS